LNADALLPGSDHWQGMIHTGGFRPKGRMTKLNTFERQSDSFNLFVKVLTKPTSEEMPTLRTMRTFGIANAVY